MIVGTAGHIDHGKTALVKALTGIDADRLKEEKARGTTIDLGYAYSDLGDGRPLGFVDVPGHERFVHNMLAGATGIDAALLIVSAVEGIKPQTVEHLQIIDLLGLDRGIVALTKADLADDDQLLERMAEIETLLASTSLKGAEIVPVSAVTGRGVDELKARLLALGESSKGATGFARLAVDRCFVLSGAGVVVTGTVHAGEFRVDDRVLLTPSGLEARVRSLHAQNRAAEVGRAGERCALNLAGPRLSKDAIRRGDWVISPELHAPADRLDIRLSLLASEGQALKHWSPAHVHLGSAHVMGRIALLEGDRLAPGDTALAQLVLDEKIGALAGDRVILRDPSAIRTIAGGTVIDPFGPPRNRRSERRLAELEALGEPDDAVLPRLLRLESGFVETGRFGLVRNLRPVDVDALLQAAGGSKVESFGLLDETLDAARKDFVETLKAHHESKPDAPGLQPERLRLTMKKRWPPAVFKALVDQALKAKTVRVDGAFLRLPGRSLTLGARDEALWQKISAELTRERFKPPRVRDFASAYSVPEPEMRKLLQRLAKVGRVVEVTPDQFFLRPVVAEMIAIAHGFGRDFSAAEFRDKLDNGRKVAILILETFDRLGITIRRGDLRRTAPQKLAQFGPPPVAAAPADPTADAPANQATGA
ncbi:selenocysteine-specific translation elongation factor [soil metagenome]